MAKPSKSRAKRKFLDFYPLYILMLPGIIATLVFAYFPMYGVQIAFKDFRSALGIWGSPWVGMDHFIRFVTFPDFWNILRNTLSITLLDLATFPLTVIVALLINEIRKTSFKKTVQMISYAPHFLSTVVAAGMVRMFLARGNGVINNIIYFFGGTRIPFLEIPEYFASIFVWSGVWQHIGFGTIIYLAALASVSPDLVEAAQIDGARRHQIIRHINIPAIIPTITILFILRTGNLLSLGFERILLLQTPLNLSASRVISTYVFEIGMEFGQFSYAAAIDLFNNIANLIIIVSVNFIARRVGEVSLW